MGLVAGKKSIERAGRLLNDLRGCVGGNEFELLTRGVVADDSLRAQEHDDRGNRGDVQAQVLGIVGTGSLVDQEDSA